MRDLDQELTELLVLLAPGGDRDMARLIVRLIRDIAKEELWDEPEEEFQNPRE